MAEKKNEKALQEPAASKIQVSGNSVSAVKDQPAKGAEKPAVSPAAKDLSVSGNSVSAVKDQPAKGAEKPAVSPAAKDLSVSGNSVSAVKDQPAKGAEKPAVSPAAKDFSVKGNSITFSTAPAGTVAGKISIAPAAGAKQTVTVAPAAANAKKNAVPPAAAEDKKAPESPAAKKETKPALPKDEKVPETLAVKKEAAPTENAPAENAAGREESRFLSFFRKTHAPDDAVAFMPDAIEIKNERLPVWARYSVLFSLGFFVLALCWATFGKVDVVVKATGKLTSNKQSIVMKPLESAVISKIHVHIGDVVSKNQLLFTFDPTLNRANADRLKNEITVLQAEYDRLRAEFEDREYKPAELTPAALEQLSIYKQRAEYFNAKVRYYDEAVKQLDASAKTKQDSLNNQQSRLGTVRKMEQMYEVLREKKTATLKELWNVQITRMEMEGNLDAIRNSLQELSHEKESTISARDGFIHEWKNSISESLVSTGRELDKNIKQYEQAAKMVSYVELRSPCHAVVHEIANFPEGSAVREAEAIITLIPLDGRIEVEAELQPRDIGKVKPESEVRIKLNAYPFQKHGTLHGFVRNISEDTLQRSGGAAAAMQEGGIPAGATYYRALIAIDDMSGLRNMPENFRMIPGMEVEAEIKTGRRRIIEYLIYPLIKALDESIREP